MGLHFMLVFQEKKLCNEAEIAGGKFITEFCNFKIYVFKFFSQSSGFKSLLITLRTFTKTELKLKASLN